MIRLIFIFILTSSISLTLILTGFSQNNPFTAENFLNKTKEVNPLSVPAKKGGNSCIACHENLKDDKLNKPVFDWVTNVHNTRGNNCNICHGGNPDSNDAKTAKSREFNFVGRPDKKISTDMCGRAGCHAEEVSDFKRGPHYAEVLKSNKSGCTSCHGVHNIKVSSPAIIDMEVCSGCHKAEHTKNVISTMRSLEQNINEVDKNIKFLKQKYLNVDTLNLKLAKTKNLVNNMIHISSKDDMKSSKSIIELEIKNLETETKTQLGLFQRLDLLYMIMVVISGIIIVTVTTYIIYMLTRRRRKK